MNNQLTTKLLLKSCITLAQLQVRLLKSWPSRHPRLSDADCVAAETEKCVHEPEEVDVPDHAHD